MLTSLWYISYEPEARSFYGNQLRLITRHMNTRRISDLYKVGE
ncbi:MAG: Unknown protein [uncultured Thiotrichaceae bacterium]|uniref:Uncharacterized protein n=1 Tax=uncultured Thiotrichaceae bacterium TaxID=298394 RepID=A0A6S6SZ79_9GAMM|nr:MAG: Unknown protein [uncultured Thiotrichaceae bacterium]